MWRQCNVAFLSTFILLLFLRIYPKPKYNFSSLFLLNITTQGVRHHSPSTTSLSLLFVRWTREGAPRAALSSLPYLDSGPWQSRLLFPGYFAYRSWPTLFCTNLRLVLLLINSDQPCSVQALACTRNLQTGVGLPLIFFLFYFIYYHPMYHNNIFAL